MDPKSHILVKTVTLGHVTSIICRKLSENSYENIAHMKKTLKKHYVNAVMNSLKTSRGYLIHAAGVQVKPQGYIQVP